MLKELEGINFQRGLGIGLGSGLGKALGKGGEGP